MKKMMRSTFGRLFNKNWVLVAAFFICGASAFTSCSNNDDNPVAGKSLAEKIVGKWIHADTDGETVTTDMKSVYTFTKNGSALTSPTASCSASAGKSRDRKGGTRTGKSSPARAARWSIKPYIGAPTAPLTPSPRT